MSLIISMQYDHFCMHNVVLCSSRKQCWPVRCYSSKYVNLRTAQWLCVTPWQCLWLQTFVNMLFWQLHTVIMWALLWSQSECAASIVSFLGTFPVILLGCLSVVSYNGSMLYQVFTQNKPVAVIGMTHLAVIAGLFTRAGSASHHWVSKQTVPPKSR